MTGVTSDPLIEQRSKEEFQFLITYKDYDNIHPENKPTNGIATAVVTVLV